MATTVTAQNIMQELNNPKNWKRTSKKNYDVYVCRPKLGTKVRNRLEGSDYITDEKKQFVISGTVGEQWVIDIGKLAKTYSFMDGKPITPDELKSKYNFNATQLKQYDELSKNELEELSEKFVENFTVL